MARRRGSGGSPTGNLDTNPDGLGVGALAGGELQHGERAVVEGLAPPAPGGGGGTSPSGEQLPPPPGSSIDLFGPTGRPDESITAGLDGPGLDGPPQPQIGDADEIDLIVRQAFAITRSPHLLQLLDRVVR